MSVSVDPNQYIVKHEPYYEAVGDEIALYEAAYSARMPMMLKGRRVAANRVSSNTWHGG